MTPEPETASVETEDETPPALPATAGPRIQGAIDVLRPDRIAGWAVDRADPARPVLVELRREGRLVARIAADRSRPDLARGGLGSGAAGFRAEIEPPLEPGFEFTLTATAVAPDGTRAELRRVGAAAPAPDPARRLLERLHADMGRLAAAQAAAAEAGPTDTRLTEALARIELAQARIDARLADLEARAAEGPARGDGGVRLIAAAALAVALVSLAAGLWSLWGG
jgi:hypothetical protein